MTPKAQIALIKLTKKLANIKKNTFKIEDFAGDNNALNELFASKSCVLKGAKSSKTCINSKKLEQIASLLEDLFKQNLELRLEKELASQIPIDFADAMVVARALLKEQKSPSLPDLISNMKKNHPNLFMDMDLILGRNKERKF